MKTSNRLLIGGGSALLILTTAVIIRLGVFALYEQPEYVYFAGPANPLLARTLPHKNFDAIKLEGVWNVKLTRGNSYAVTVKATEEIHRHLRIAVADGILRIRQEYIALNRADQTHIAVTLPSLKALRIRGGNDIDISDFQEERTTIEVEGINVISCESGRMDALRLAGSGLIGVNLSACAVTDAELELSGLGEVNLKMAGGSIHGEIERNISLIHTGPVRENSVRVLKPSW